MDDLEESIFQRNVPGKYSRWEQDEKVVPEEPDPGDQGDGEIDFDAPVEDDDIALLRYAEELSKTEVPEPIRRRILAERAAGPSTGVKGVLADYKAAQALALAEGQAEALSRQQIITRMVEGAKVKTATDAFVEELVEEALAGGGDDEDSDGFDDDGEDAFMREFRAKRLQELKAANAQSSQKQSEMPIFGTVREIRSEEFLSEIDGADSRVVVVLHLYEPVVQGCVRMNSMLEEIAATMPGTKFLRMQASSNEIDVDRVALPILTLYRAGQEISTIAGIAADFGQYFTAKDITWLLDTSIGNSPGGGSA